MRYLIIALILYLVAGNVGWAPANPVPIPFYGWEDGGTVLGLYGSGNPPIIATNVSAPAPFWTGNFSLELQDNSPDDTPQAYVAFVWNLEAGDVVTAGFWRYDTTPGGSPSCRIWAHWNDHLPDNPDGFDGSAGGNVDYGPGTGWDYVYWDWTVESPHSGLVIEVRTYSNPGDTIWIDDIAVLAPEGAFIKFPGPGSIANQNLTWGSVKVLYGE
jgi:hypothetical protein